MPAVEVAGLEQRGEEGLVRAFHVGFLGLDGAVLHPRLKLLSIVILPWENADGSRRAAQSAPLTILYTVAAARAAAKQATR